MHLPMHSYRNVLKIFCDYWLIQIADWKEIFPKAISLVGKSASHLQGHWSHSVGTIAP